MTAAAALAVAAAALALVGFARAPHHASPAFVTFRLPREAGRTVAPDAPDFARSAPGGAPLLVFLPATGAAPRRYQRFLDTAHAVGYSVLGLDYPDAGPSLARSCAADMACYDDTLANRFDGADPSRFSRVTAQNAILDRLDDALDYLDVHDPGGDWGRYRSGDGVRWGSVVLAGHSQGGSEAVYIAHLHRVRGVLAFSAPAEALGGRTPSWVSTPGATPATRMWALDDTHDVYAQRILPTWRALGIQPGEPTRLPRAAHGLLTTLELGTPGQAHGRVVSDRTPLGTRGEPVLEPVWRWMLRQACGAGGTGGSRFADATAGHRQRA